MDTVDIQLFLAIADTNSITKAAEILHLSQSTISYRLQALEKELGVQLFLRQKGNRFIELTSDGELFVPIAEQWLALHVEAQAIQSRTAESLTICTVDSVSTSVFPEIYKRMVGSDPPVRLQIRTHQSAEIFNQVDNRSADLGFVSFLYQRRNVVVQPIIQQKYYLIRYSERPVAPRKVDPRELDPACEIFQTWGGDYNRWHEYMIGSPASAHVWLDTVALLQHFLTEPRFWAILPDASLRQLLGGFRTVQIDELTSPPPDRLCYMVKNTRPRASSVRGIELFERHLEAYLEELREQDPLF